MPFADHTLEKREHLLREKKDTFLFSRKKGHILIHFQGAYFFYTTLILTHETPKIWPAQAGGKTKIRKSKKYLIDNYFCVPKIIIIGCCFVYVSMKKYNM